MHESAVGLDHARIAEVLERAETTRVAIPPLTETYPGLSTADAYAIQRAWFDARQNRQPQRLVGHKIGLTARAMQEQLGVREPDFGFLLENMLVSDAGTIPRADLLQPRVEPEIAFHLSHDLSGPGVTRADVLRATHEVAPALEIVDSRIANWKIKLQDTIADNGSSARAVVGPAMPRAQLDLAAVSVALSRNGEVAGRGDGAAVMGHPAEAVAWLANALAEYGETLRAGQVILPGAMCASVFAEAGDEFVAEFAGLGRVSVRFS